MERIKRVLLVDDDGINNFLNERLIRKLQLADEIIVTCNGKEGIDYLKFCREKEDILPQLIFLDINMPVMDGFDFVKALDTIDPSLQSRIIFLTTSRSPRDIEKIQNLGSFRYINKPLSEQKIKSCLSSIAA